MSWKVLCYESDIFVQATSLSFTSVGERVQATIEFLDDLRNDPDISPRLGVAASSILVRNDLPDTCSDDALKQFRINVSRVHKQSSLLCCTMRGNNVVSSMRVTGITYNHRLHCLLAGLSPVHGCRPIQSESTVP